MFCKTPQLVLLFDNIIIIVHFSYPRPHTSLLLKLLWNHGHPVFIVITSTNRSDLRRDFEVFRPRKLFF
jgi:hypothetical protein